VGVPGNVGSEAQRKALAKELGRISRSLLATTINEDGHWPADRFPVIDSFLRANWSTRYSVSPPVLLVELLEQVVASLPDNKTIAGTSISIQTAARRLFLIKDSEHLRGVEGGKFYDLALKNLLDQATSGPAATSSITPADLRNFSARVRLFVVEGLLRLAGIRAADVMTYAPTPVSSATEPPAKDKLETEDATVEVSISLN